jgi:rare lipoprotein A
MRITLITIAILVSLSATARAELIASQSLTTPFDVPTLASSALNRDSKTVTANSLAITAASNTLASQTTNTDLVSNITKANNNDSVSDDQDSNLSVLDRLSSVASDTVRKFKQTGIASWYDCCASIASTFLLHTRHKQR